jgi:hypothetical protein
MSDKVFAEKTFRKFIGDDVIVVEAKLSSLSGQAPYFSMTADLYDRGRLPGEASMENANGKRRYLGSCGQLTDEIAEHFPELVKYQAWHLTSIEQPLHYVANALYWFGQGNIEYTKSTIVFGKVATDDLLAFDVSPELLKKRLKGRLPALMERFHAEMVELFGEKTWPDTWED